MKKDKRPKEKKTRIIKVKIKEKIEKNIDGNVIYYAESEDGKEISFVSKEVWDKIVPGKEQLLETAVEFGENLLVVDVKEDNPT